MDSPAAYLVFGLLAASLLLAAIRVFRGPSLPDRVAALDLVGMIVGAVLASAALFAGLPMLLDVLLVFSILLFCGTVMFARHLERNLDDPR